MRSRDPHSLLPAAIIVVVADDSGDQPFAILVLPEVYELSVALVGITSWMGEPVRPQLHSDVALHRIDFKRPVHQFVDKAANRSLVAGCQIGIKESSKLSRI